MEAEGWKSAITKVAPNDIRVRGVPLHEIMVERSFASAFFLLLMSRVPTPGEEKVVNAVLTAALDHGATAPSTHAARTVASTRMPLSASVAAGLLTIGPVHGGAIQPCMDFLKGVISQVVGGRPPSDAARAAVKATLDSGERVPGFGHRMHAEDPRATALLELAKKEKVAGTAVAAALAVEEAIFALKGRRLPLNVDGAMGAVLVDLGVPSEAGNAFFLVGRVPGLVAHSLEEADRERPMRPIHPTKIEYDGPSGEGAAGRS